MRDGRMKRHGTLAVEHLALPSYPFYDAPCEGQWYYTNTHPLVQQLAHNEEVRGCFLGHRVHKSHNYYEDEA